jgi:ribonuclease HI
VAGVRGVIFDLDGNQESTYPWGLKIGKNNQDEVYAPFQGLFIAISLRIRELVVIGDSKIIINSMTHQELMKDS